MHALVEALAWVGAGSLLGGPARFLVSGIVGRRIGETFPWGTLVINATGSLAIGMIAGAAAGGGLFAAPGAWAFAVTGFLGSYTTVSSFSLQTLALVRDGEIGRAFLYTALSFILCLALVGAGYALIAGNGAL